MSKICPYAIDVMRVVVSKDLRDRESVAWWYSSYFLRKALQWEVK